MAGAHASPNTWILLTVCLLGSVACGVEGYQRGGIPKQRAPPDLTDLHSLVRMGDVLALAKVLSKRDELGLDINVIGNGGQTPLMSAVLGGFTEAVELLLDAGADTTIGEQDGYTPMHGAAFQGRPDIARELLRRGLDPNPRHADGFTPIFRACWGREERHTETVRVFLEAGVSATARALDGPGGHPGGAPLDHARRMQTKNLLKEWIARELESGDGHGEGEGEL